MEKIVQNVLPFEVTLEDLPPVDQSGKKGQNKKEAPPNTSILQGYTAKTEQELSQVPGEFVSVKDIPLSAPIPIAVRPQFEEIGEIILSVCKKGIDEEYYYLGIMVLEKLARKRPSPILAGKAHAWAAGILFALGKINFLFDKSTQPYISQDDLAGLCGVKKSSAADKGKLIRNMFNMIYWDARFSTRSMEERDPFKNLFMTKNGFIFNIKHIL